MVTISRLTHTFRNGTRLSFPDITVERGKACLLLGASGSGKTTLLHLLGGLRSGGKGTIAIDGTDILSLNSAALDSFRGKHIGFVFQKNHLIPSLTVRQNILLAPALNGRVDAGVRASDLLARLGIGQIADSKPRSISHGQAQRAAIARAVINKPGLILADEPTSALDDANCALVARLLSEIASVEKASLIIATHDHRLAEFFSHRVELKNTSNA